MNTEYIIGCDCYLKDEGYFCSRSCKRAALEENIICDDDIEHDISNFKLKKESFDNLKLNKKLINEEKYTITKKYYSDGTVTKEKEIQNTSR